jgi:hypothetical protein
MKSIFYYKKGIIDPYYLVASDPTLLKAVMEVGMDGWMDGDDQRRDSNTLNNLSKHAGMTNKPRLVLNLS